MVGERDRVRDVQPVAAGREHPGRRARLRGGHKIDTAQTRHGAGDVAKVRMPDATFQAQRAMDREQIAVAFGVPPS
ncbi:MAG: hypothetical protein ACO3D0_13825, partial [Ilumatobacteraceae bacterium]